MPNMRSEEPAQTQPARIWAGLRGAIRVDPVELSDLCLSDDSQHTWDGYKSRLFVYGI
jgi:hypothetical protein